MMERLICLGIGYAFGLIQSGYLYGRSKGLDIRQYGSGNAGSTNVLRVMGAKAGAVVFLGDFSRLCSQWGRHSFCSDMETELPTALCGPCTRE